VKQAVMPSFDATRSVVVGVDGSDDSDAALRWAVDEARRRRAPLCVVHAMDQRHSDAFVRANPEFVAEERHAAEQVLTTAVEHAGARAPELELRSVLDPGTPAVALLGRAAAAGLVVVGSRGRGGFAGLLLGSTSLQVAMHAPGPVVVLRHGTVDEPGAPVGRVVVGTDGSPRSGQAVEFAFLQAQERGVGLIAVHGRPSPAIYVDMPSSEKWKLAEKQDRASLSEFLAPWRRRYSTVDVVEKCVLGNASAALVDESADADLLVVGSRGRGGFSGLVLGSVSHACLHHAHCPVAVVRC
jgi:nucleotide-binding universal stress UspA family protein